MKLDSFNGCTIDGIEIERCILERCFCDCNNQTDTRTMNEWVLHIGVCVSNNKLYLCLEGNDKGLLFSNLLDTGMFDDMESIIELSFDEANEIIDYLQRLSAENKNELVPGFSEIMQIIIDSVPCRVLFEPCDVFYGEYISDTITIANNNSQVTMLFALLHEVTHFLRQSKKHSPHFLSDYVLDEEENICNATALILLDFILDNHLKTNVEVSEQELKKQLGEYLQKTEPSEKFFNFAKCIAKDAEGFSDKVRNGSISSFESIHAEGLFALMFCQKKGLMIRVYYYVLTILKRMARNRMVKPITIIPQTELYCIPYNDSHRQYIEQNVLSKMKSKN